MLKFKGRTYDVSDELIKEHGKYYKTPVEDWRIENYIRQKTKDRDGDIEDILDRFGNDKITDSIEEGLATETEFRSGSRGEPSLSIKNPKLHNEE